MAPHENRQITAPTILHQAKYLNLVQRGHWEYVERTTQRPAVAMVAITDERELVLVEQFRIPVGCPVVELPAGIVGDIAGSEDEPLIDAAKRELLEETGYVAERWTSLGEGFSSAGLTNESVVLYLAEGLERVGEGGGDGSEEITVHLVPIDDVTDWLAARKARFDFKIMAGILLAEELLTKRKKDATS